jgi:WD40 repeat protein
VFSSDGLHLAANSSSTSNITKLFNTSNWNFIRDFEGKAGVDFSPDGVFIATGSNTGSSSIINLWNVSDGSLFNVINKPYANSFMFKFDASGKYIFGSDRDYIYGFEILTGNNVFKTQPIAGTWYFIDTDPLGRTFSAGGNHGRARLWRIKDFQISMLEGLGYNQTAYDGQYTPDGLKFAILNDDGISLWSLNYRWIQIN